jgi:hypothetical protein
MWTVRLLLGVQGEAASPTAKNARRQTWLQAEQICEGGQKKAARINPRRFQYFQMLRDVLIM